MPSIKLTAKGVDSLTVAKGQVDYFDEIPVIKGAGGRV